MKGIKKAKQDPMILMKNAVLSFFVNLILIIFSISCIFPLIWMIYSSFKTTREFARDFIGLPKGIDLENYIYVIKGSGAIKAILNSTRVTVVSIILIVAMGFVLGYIFARFRFKGSKILYSSFLIGLLVPIHSLLVPIYIIFSKTGLNDKWFTLVIPYVAFGIPIAMFLVESSIKAIPIALEEAAAIDGSSFSRTLFQIILPITKPILATIAIIQTFACWNEFSFALVLINTPKLRTVPVEITLFTGQFTSNYPRMFAAMLICMLPIVTLYFLFSKQIMQGMVAGAVKG